MPESLLALTAFDSHCISVVLMDELDQLLTAKQDVVYNFFNWPTLRDSQLFVIAIANRMDLPQHLAAKVKSRLGEPCYPDDNSLLRC